MTAKEKLRSLWKIFNIGFKDIKYLDGKDIVFVVFDWELFKLGDWRQADDDSWSQQAYNYHWYIADKFSGLPIDKTKDSKIANLRGKVNLDKCTWYSGYNICPLYWWLNIPLQLVATPIKDPATFAFGARPEPKFNQEFNIGENNHQDSANNNASCLFEKVGNQWVGGFDYGTKNMGLRIRISPKWKLPEANSCLFLNKIKAANANYQEAAEVEATTDEATTDSASTDTAAFEEDEHADLLPDEETIFERERFDDFELVYSTCQDICQWAIDHDPYREKGVYDGFDYEGDVANEDAQEIADAKTAFEGLTRLANTKCYAYNAKEFMIVSDK
jgi:hypothetical protein